MVVRALKMNAAWSILHSFMVLLMIVGNRTELLDWLSAYDDFPFIFIAAIVLGSYVSLAIALLFSIIGIFSVRSLNSSFLLLLVLSSISCSTYFFAEIFMTPIH